VLCFAILSAVMNVEDCLRPLNKNINEEFIFAIISLAYIVCILLHKNSLLEEHQNIKVIKNSLSHHLFRLNSPHLRGCSGKVIRYYSDCLESGQGGRNSSPCRVKNFHFSTSSSPALGYTQPPVQWVQGSFRGVKRKGREADHSPPTTAEVKNAWIYTTTPHTFSWGSA
jgi:hypothetical protein